MVHGRVGRLLIVFALVCGTTRAASAQSTERWSIGGAAGVSAVEKVGALAGGEVAWQPSRRVSLVAESIWFQNVATRRQIDRANEIGDYLGQTQGGSASGSVEAPSTYVGGSVRLNLSSGPRVLPYIFGGGGAAHVALQPSFTLNGADVTASMDRYGITLGTDLTGESWSGAATAGFGIRLPRGRWYFDAAFRYTAIFADDQTIGVIGAAAGLGVSF